jgi:hypothetical protein
LGERKRARKGIVRERANEEREGGKRKMEGRVENREKGREEWEEERKEGKSGRRGRKEWTKRHKSCSPCVGRNPYL